MKLLLASYCSNFLYRIFKYSKKEFKLEDILLLEETDKFNGLFKEELWTKHKFIRICTRYTHPQTTFIVMEDKKNRYYCMIDSNEQCYTSHFEKKKRRWF